MTTTTRTRTRHVHWCEGAHWKNRDQAAPDHTCDTTRGAITCTTETYTARAVRRFKTRPGQVRVTWSDGGMTWENDR